MNTFIENPSNEEHFDKLKKFAQKIIQLLQNNNLNPILYGSAAFFVYTKNTNLKINDIDFYVNESDLNTIVKILEQNSINFNYPKEWHTIEITEGDVKVEMDSINFWYDGPKEFEDFQFENTKIKILSLNGLKHIYKKASIESSKKEINLQKHEELNKI